MKEISAAIIAKNEKKEFLQKAIKSIYPIIEEIIIIDYSTEEKVEEKIDKTDKIKIIKGSWADDFSEARNLSLKMSTKDIIFVLDTDEAISPLDYPALTQIKKIEIKDIWGISLPTRNYFKKEMIDFRFIKNRKEYPEMEKGLTGYIVSEKTRIFPNRREIFFEGKIHETVENSIIKNKGKIIKKEKPVIHHYGYIKDEIKLKEKQNLYIKLLKEQLKEKETFKTVYDLANQLYSSGQYEEAERHFDKLLKTKKREDLLFFLAATRIKLKKYKKALQNLNSIKKENAPLLYYKAICYKGLNEADKAVPLLRKALRLSKNNPEFMNELASVYKTLGKYKLAKTTLEKIKKLQINEF